SCGAPASPPHHPAGEGEGEGEGAQNACVPAASGPGFAISAKGDLRWKRAAAVQADLEKALALDDNSVCSEVGLAGTCFSLIHLVPLGGNDPVKGGLYKPLAEPGVTSSLSFDRVVLSACGIRADAEFLSAVPKVVFTNIDFSAPSLSHDDPAVAADIKNLYHRLLAREPTADEVTQVARLADDVNGAPVPPRDFAKMACYTVATTSEFLFQ
ncbi:MAG TPA: hypothetical protein VGO62_20200, partial [Myxococcota bacterium]